MLWMFTWNEMKLNEWKTLFKCQQYLALKKKKTKWEHFFHKKYTLAKVKIICNFMNSA